MNFMNKYQQKELIKNGGFGIIFKVIDLNNNKFYALKFIKNDINSCKTEINIMKNIKSKYIVELKDNFYDEVNKGYCIVMELCDGSLKDILDKNKPKGLPIELIKKIFIQLNEGLKAMINKGFYHRDLKPDNILIKYIDSNKKNFDIKLTGFGFTINKINSNIQTH